MVSIWLSDLELNVAFGSSDLILSFNFLMVSFEWPSLILGYG